MKNLLILSGVVAAVALGQGPVAVTRVAAALVATCLVASANYVLNGCLDATSDSFHPRKHARPAVLGKVSVGGASLEYALFALGGLAISLLASKLVLVMLVVLLALGAAYNVPPVRLKDHPYADVLTESMNDGVRLLIGWFAVTTSFLPPASLVLGFWSSGAFLMTVKRLAEYRSFSGSPDAARYRRSFDHYTAEKLTVLALLCAMAASFFLGVLLVRYRYEYLLAMPAFWTLFAWYLAMGFREGSAAQNPETLWRESPLLLLMALLVVLLVALTFIDIPALQVLGNTNLVGIDAIRIGTP